VKSFTERNPTIVGVIVIALIAAGTGSALLLNGGFFKDRYTVHAVFSDTAGLKKGDKVRVAGVLAGEVKGVELDGRKVQVDLAVDHGIHLPRDTRADIVVETLLGNKYVRLVAGHDWAHPLQGGDTIDDTSTPTEVLDVQNIGTPLLEDLDAKSFNSLLGKIDKVTAGQRGNVGDIITGLDKLTTAIDQRNQQARHLIGATKTVTGTLSARDQDLLDSLDDLNVLVDGLAKRRVQLATLLDQTAQTARKTADLVASNRPKIDSILDEIHADLAIVDRRQQELAASLSGLSNAISGFASVGYSGPDRYPNQWANMYTQLIGPLSPDALFGSCGLLDDAFDVIIGPDPVKSCDERTGPLPGAAATSASKSGGASGSKASTSPSGAKGSSGQASTTNPLEALFGPLAGVHS
jgi:phospholipid/cholesterol/gamma-HCH transport system substrate-binding protein